MGAEETRRRETGRDEVDVSGHQAAPPPAGKGLARSRKARGGDGHEKQEAGCPWAGASRRGGSDAATGLFRRAVLGGNLASAAREIDGVVIHAGGRRRATMTVREGGAVAAPRESRPWRFLARKVPSLADILWTQGGGPITEPQATAGSRSFFDGRQMAAMAPLGRKYRHFRKRSGLRDYPSYSIQSMMAAPASPKPGPISGRHRGVVIHRTRLTATRDLPQRIPHG